MFMNGSFPHCLYTNVGPIHSGMNAYLFLTCFFSFSLSLHSDLFVSFLLSSSFLSLSFSFFLSVCFLFFFLTCFLSFLFGVSLCPVYEFLLLSFLLLFLLLHCQYTFPSFPPTYFHDQYFPSSFFSFLSFFLPVRPLFSFSSQTILSLTFHLLRIYHFKFSFFSSYDHITL
ncbi:unnamed protein product [Acanthosepion pharaonis]|uniref:Uncharacterized protein n=1 Tax=Acanthosepion pharaonis TaxID=158019 RepID=A0A812BVT6_ACAPH|nr:unnamed protein product [Sepia pharaonis]